VVSNDWAFAALNAETHDLRCWGHPRLGGDCDAIAAEVRDYQKPRLHAGGSSFVVVDQASGQVSCWGSVTDCAGLNLAGTPDIYATSHGFLALNRASGALRCFGALRCPSHLRLEDSAAQDVAGSHVERWPTLQEAADSSPGGSQTRLHSLWLLAELCVFAVLFRTAKSF
jgi:hypothetical protein